MAPRRPSRLNPLNIRVPGFSIRLFYYIAPLLVASYSAIGYYNDFLRTRLLEPNSQDPLHYETFDFIIVGAGSSGAALASSLQKNNRVLLLEAGGNPHPLASVPIANAILLNQASIAWQHRTIPQVNNSQGLINHMARWPRGKSLGGSSVLNSMIYMRGHPKDYDNWAAMTGDDEWRYENLLPFFKKLEDYHGHFPNASVHGTGGPVYVEKLRAETGVNFWLDAGKEVGYETKDLNRDQLKGFAPMDVTMKKGTRFDTYRAYLRPLNRKRNNLAIYRYSQVTKIHLDKGKRAYGVTYFRFGVQKFVRARKEIIISAGSLNTPHLLMLSGIGEKKHLNSKGIKCRVHLPNVGKNLQDHIFTNIGPITLDKPVSLIADRDVTLRSFTDFLFNGSGPLVSITGISGAGAFTSSLAKDPEWPDIIFHYIGAGVHKTFGRDQEESFGFQKGFLSRFYKPSVGKDANFVLVVLGRPESTGRVWLKSKDPFDMPMLDAGYLTKDVDLKVFLEGIRFILNLFQNTKTFQNLGAKLSPHPLLECSSHEFNSDEYWKCFLRHYAITIHHQCCTCPMGEGLHDPFAVVDPELRVLKTKNLRVIDMSVFPKIINANPNIPCVMLGEKGAFMIRRHWASQYAICDKKEYFLYNDESKCYYSRKS